jgi:hypothetical protein
VAYAAQRPGWQSKGLVVVDGVEGKEYGEFVKGGELVFDSPNLLHAVVRRGFEYLRVEIEIVTPAAEPAAPR